MLCHATRAHLAFVSLVLLGFGCSQEPVAFPERVREWTGPGAHECGTLGIDDDPTDAHQCLVEQFQVGSPAYLVRQLLGHDSDILEALALSSNGKHYSLLYDSGISGHATTTVYECKDAKLGPVEKAVTSGFWAGRPVGQNWIVCGELTEVARF